MVIFDMRTAPRSRPLALATLLGLGLAVGACDERYKKPIAFAPHGEAVRWNMAQQIIDPLPPRRWPLLTDASVPVRALGAYRKGKVKDPPKASVSSSGGALK